MINLISNIDFIFVYVKRNDDGNDNNVDVLVNYDGNGNNDDLKEAYFPNKNKFVDEYDIDD